MTDLFDLASPRHDVLEGTLSDAIFAASLDDVVAGTAPPVYGEAATFFAGTYASAGLRSLLNEVLGRVGGGRPDGAPVVRLETNLGGGKTHNLIALYHAARGDLAPTTAAEFMDPALLPAEPVQQVAVFVGTSSGASSFSPIDGITPHTLWGAIALQLGGTTAYELVRADDEALTAPGAHALRSVFGGRPSLVLLDEIARYLAAAAGVTVGESTLARQTTAFLMALMEAVGAEPHAALVITTTQVTDAFGDQTGQVLEAIAEAQSLLARKEHVLRPSEEADLPSILARRLFDTVDATAAAQVAADYAQAATGAAHRGIDLPERMTGPGFAAEVARTYPFHPELVSVLDKRLSTIPNFQRTRGALRLLARTVRLLWNDRPEGTRLIHLHHVDLADAELVEEVSSRIDRATFEPVIRADIAAQPGSGRSHAEEVDGRLGIPYARRLAIAAYLWSLTRDVPGVPAGALIGSVLAPDDDPNLIVKALDTFEQAAWYLHSDVRGYRFSTEASLPRLIQETESQVTPGRVKQEATDILARQFRDSAFKVRRTWEDAKVADREDDAWLVVLHWDEFGADLGASDPAAVPSQVRELWEKSPTGGVREFRNRLVFLVPHAASHDSMLRTVRRHLALRDLVGSDTLRLLPDEKRKDAIGLAKASEAEARIAVCNHLRVLYVPQAGGLEGLELDVVTQAGLKPNQTDAVIERLAAMEKTLAAGDKKLDPAYIRSKLGTQMDTAYPTRELQRAFARRADLKLVLDTGRLVDLVGDGIRNGVWDYHDETRGTDDGWATRDRPAVGGIRVAEDTVLHPPGTAPAPAAVKPILAPLLPKPGPAGSTFTTDGKADVALEAARQKAADAKRTLVSQIRLAIEELGSGTKTELARLLSVVPATEPGATLAYAITVNVSLGAEARLDVTFAGPPPEWQPLRTGVEAVLDRHEAVVKASVMASFDPPIERDGPAFAAVLQRAHDTGPAKCTVMIVCDDAQAGAGK